MESHHDAEQNDIFEDLYLFLNTMESLDVK